MTTMVELHNDGYTVELTITGIRLLRGMECITEFPVSVEIGKDIAHAALGMAAYLQSAKQNAERRERNG